jgi:hypothetical protein
VPKCFLYIVNLFYHIGLVWLYILGSFNSLKYVGERSGSISNFF